MKWLLSIVFLVGCAHGKMGVVDQELSKGSISPETTIYVEPISTEGTKFSGDKSAKQDKVAAEKAEIQQRFHRDLAEQLKKHGFKAQAVKESAKSGLVLSGQVTRFEHGSAAARIFVGMGAGSSNLYTDFKLEDRTKNKVLSKFEIIATSGGNSGLQSAGGYIKAHIIDGAEKAAEYLATANGYPKK